MPSTAIITSFMHQRGGDLVAATSFMKAVLDRSPDMKFEWIIKRDISGYQKDLHDFLKKELGDRSYLVNLTVIDSANYNDVTITSEGVVDNLTQRILSIEELTKRSDLNWGTVSTGWHGWKDIHQQITSNPIATKIASVNAIAVIGNPHRLVKKDHEVLHRFGKKIITIPEYSLKHPNNVVYNQGDLKMPTGFATEYGQAERGVYIDDTVKSTDGFEKIDVLDKSFLNHLLLHNDLTQKELYHTNTHLFYGYFFDNEKLTATQYTVQAESYIQNVIKLAIDCGGKPKIDIVIPGFANPENLKKIYERALRSLPQEYRNQIRCAKYDVKSTSEEYISQSIIESPDVNTQYEIRLVNPKRLQRLTIQSILNESDPFIGLTGDASWIEGLMKGKIICYQTMQWKKSFYDGFLQYLGTKDFLKNSPLHDFYKLQAPDYKSGVGERWQEMCKLYRTHKDQMMADAKILALAIESEKNINKNLIPDFIKIVLSEKKIQETNRPKLMTIISLCENYKKHLKPSLTNDLSNLVDQKYNLVTEMLAAITDESIDEVLRIQNMEKILTEENKTILKSRRDSSEGAKFLENILHILSLGIYSWISKGTFSFWKSHGETVIDEIETFLSESVSAF